MENSASPDFNKIRSGIEIRSDAKSWRVPRRADYFEYLVEQGYIESEDEILGRKDLVRSIQLHWHRRGQTGCKFAQRLSNAPSDHGWHLAVADSSDPMALAKWVDDIVRAAVANSDIEALSLLFPHLIEPKGLAALVGELMALPSWSVENSQFSQTTLVVRQR